MKKEGRADFSKIRTYPIRERENKVKYTDFAKDLPGKGIKFNSFLDKLPNVLAAKSFKEIVSSIVKARKKDKPVIFSIGAHVIKCGLSPVIISLMKEGIVTAVAMNGAGSIHDFEVALIGGTSEDVVSGLEDGMFGMVEETGKMMNEAIIDGVRQGIGAGKSLAERILREDFKFREYSILANSIEFGIPVTVHIALGTDIIHQHPSCDGAAIGEASYIDFQTFTNEVSHLGNGGVLINFGSAVIMPEVFLKALTIARNLGHNVKNFVTADFDMIGQYRPVNNVLRRPMSLGGRSYSIRGHHEIMIPLLAQAITEEMEG